MQAELSRARSGWAEAIALAVALLTLVLAPIFCLRDHARSAANTLAVPSLRLNAATIYSIDSVVAAGKATPIGGKPLTLATVPAGVPVTMNGWAVDAPNKAAPSSVEVQVDDVTRVPATLGIRDDVARMAGAAAYERSGFYVEIPASALPAGPHVLHLLIGDTHGTGYYVANSVVDLTVR